MDVQKLPDRNIWNITLDRFEFDAFELGRRMREREMEKNNPFHSGSLPREYSCYELGWHHGYFKEGEEEFRQLAVTSRHQSVKMFYASLLEMMGHTIMVNKAT